MRPTRPPKAPTVERNYSKSANAKATVAEAQAVANAAAVPAVVGARFALILSGLAFILSAVALGVAVRR